MDYIRLRLKIDPYDAGINDILIAGLDTMGYEGFQEEEPFLLAYIPSDAFNRNELVQYIGERGIPGISITMEETVIPPRNWNEEWERGYPPVIIEGIVAITAPFHPLEPGIPNIIIEPKMSFGTGHHETTRLMIRQMAHTAMVGNYVLDIGCGTGILGIFALLKGAASVTGIDTDEWAISNSRENFRRNAGDEENYDLLLGDAGSIPGRKYDIILANINRNIILRDIPVYRRHLSPGGILLLSGILLSDRAGITEAAETLGLRFVEELYDNNWISIKFKC